MAQFSMNPAALPSTSGTYALILEVSHRLTLCVGRLGLFTLAPGFYVYVGSAHGAGGLRARVGRHLRREKRRHWHIDHLTAAAPITDIYALSDKTSLECAWVRRLIDVAGATVPIKHFGNSDCRQGCPAHLVRLPDSYAYARLGELLE